MTQRHDPETELCQLNVLSNVVQREFSLALLCCNWKKIQSLGEESEFQGFAFCFHWTGDAGGQTVPSTLAWGRCPAACASLLQAAPA